MIKYQKLERGFAAFYITILILVVVFVLAVSIFVLTSGQQKIAQNIVKSTQAYYGAEAGIEDALLRLVKSTNWSSPYSFYIGSGSTTVEISDIIGGTRTITGKGNFSNRIRKIQILYKVSTQQVSFYYGAQVGDGGMEMANNSSVEGNIYSNGNVTSAGGGDKGYITDSITVAVNGNRIEGLQIGKDAKVHTCKDSTIGGTLTYVSGGSIQNCTVNQGTVTQPNEIPRKDLPIPQTQIDKWKQEAENGGVISGDYTISGKMTINFGPKKITGNLLIDNNATVNMLGTIWVVGDFRIDNGATVQLDSGSYGQNSGIIVVDGKIKVRPGTSLRGTGLEGSYLLLLSTNPEVSAANPAIDVDNNTDAAIFYTTQGLIVLRNQIKAREVTGYKIILDNNAEIKYESGLADTSFSSGPGGGSWEVAGWREVE